MKTKNLLRELRELTLIILLMFLGPWSRAQVQVNFYGVEMTGQTNPFTVNVQAVNNPTIWNGVYYWLPDAGTNLPSTNGLATAYLAPGAYTASILGLAQSWSVNVPFSTNALNAANLSSGVTYYSGVQTLTGSGGISVTQSTPGNFDIDGSQISGPAITNGAATATLGGLTLTNFSISGNGTTFSWNNLGVYSYGQIGAAGEISSSYGFYGPVYAYAGFSAQFDGQLNGWVNGPITNDTAGNAATATVAMRAATAETASNLPPGMNFTNVASISGNGSGLTNVVNGSLTSSVSTNAYTATSVLYSYGSDFSSLNITNWTWNPNFILATHWAGVYTNPYNNLIIANDTNTLDPSAGSEGYGLYNNVNLANDIAGSGSNLGNFPTNLYVVIGNGNIPTNNSASIETQIQAGGVFGPNTAPNILYGTLFTLTTNVFLNSVPITQVVQQGVQFYSGVIIVPTNNFFVTNLNPVIAKMTNYFGTYISTNSPTIVYTHTANGTAYANAATFSNIFNSKVFINFGAGPDTCFQMTTNPDNGWSSSYDFDNCIYPNLQEEMIYSNGAAGGLMAAPNGPWEPASSNTWGTATPPPLSVLSNCVVCSITNYGPQVIPSYGSFPTPVAFLGTSITAGGNNLQYGNTHVYAGNLVLNPFGDCAASIAYGVLVKRGVASTYLNLGMHSAQASWFTNTTYLYVITNTMVQNNCHLVNVELGINEALTAVPTLTFSNALSSLCRALVQCGATVILNQEKSATNADTTAQELAIQTNNAVEFGFTQGAYNVWGNTYWSPSPGVHQWGMPIYMGDQNAYAVFLNVANFPAAIHPTYTGHEALGKLWAAADLNILGFETQLYVTNSFASTNALPIF